MNEYGMFERALIDVLAHETQGAPVDRIAANVFETTRTIKPRPTLLATLRESPMRIGSRPAVGLSRRQLALAAVVAALLLAAAVALVGSLLRPSEGPDWLGPRGGPTRMSSSLTGPVGLPVLRWRVDVGAAVRSDPVVLGESVFVVSEDGLLHALNLADGTQRWRFDPGTSLVGPSSDGMTLFVVDGQGVVHALDVDGGRQRWASAALGQGASGTLAAEGKVFVSGSEGSIAALDLGTGALRWRATLGAEPVHIPAYADGRLLAATDDGLLVAVNAADGATIWKVEIGNEGTGTPVVANGLVYLGARSDNPIGRLRAFDAGTGDPRWTIDEPLFGPAVLGSLAVSASAKGAVVARDAITGVERWRFGSAGTTRGPVIAGSIVYVANDLDQQVFALDAAAGGLLWTFPVDAGNQCCVVVAKNHVMVGTLSGSIYALTGDGSTLVPTAPSVPPSVLVPEPTATASSSLPEAFSVVRRIALEDVGVRDPLAVAVGPSGDIYVSDQSHHVTHLDAEGNFLGRWGGLGEAPGQFDFLPAQSSANPHGSLAVAPDGKVYVSDSDNHRVQVFSSDGEFLREFGSSGSAPGEFTIPFDLSVDANGNVVVADDGLERITKFSPEGDVLWVVDGTTDPALRGHAHTLDLDASGRIVAIVDDTGMVVVLDSDGRVVDAYPAPGCDVTMDAAGRQYVTGCEGGLTVYGADHMPVATSAIRGLGTPRFGRDGRVVALTSDGSIVFLAIVA